jgi:hypothetical protein
VEPKTETEETDTEFVGSYFFEQPIGSPSQETEF